MKKVKDLSQLQAERSVLAPEILYQELNLLKIEGFAFSFDPRKRNTGNEASEFMQHINTPEGKIEERPVMISPSSAFGRPSPVAYKVLNAILDTQYRYGSEVMLAESKIESEVLYNKYDIFRSLFSWYLYAGSLLFIVLIFQIFNNNRVINSLITIFKYSIYLLFALHAAGLCWRWYISGHAPWSDGYESMIYVSWVTMLFGIVFGRRSDLTIASTAFVASMILMIAHWSWMDPAIANLVPVLDSYWLMIHVSIIVGSYGPFTLSMILGLVTLILITLVNNKNKEIMEVEAV